MEFTTDPIEGLFWQALALIAAACFFAPVFRRLGLGTILGYLAAGLAVQLAFSESMAEHPEELMHFAEFGVVLFLFVIGLELKPSSLWAMRGDIFGLGLAQMLICGAVLGAAASVAGFSWSAALIVGLGLALSSTALVMQMLDERGERATQHGRQAFAILLFQDLAIVPLLLLVSFLAPSGETFEIGDSLLRIGIAVAAIGALVLTGRFLLDPMFHLLARARMPELMTASALGVVIASGLLMDLAGLSYAMGAFLAGVLLAESAFRHEVEANVEPFRGIFLGLFFIAVGLSLDLNAVAANWILILLATPLAMALKGAAIYAIARGFRTSHNVAARIGLLLCQHGEFGFVLFAAAASSSVLDGGTASTLIAIVTLSMAMAPLVMRLEPRIVRSGSVDTIDETFDDAQGSTLIIGFGRFGQIVAQPLFARGLQVTILDSDADRVREAERFGFRVHFGDGTRRDVMRAAGAGDADMIVVCVDNPKITNHIVDMVRAEFKEVRIHVRAFDRRHSIELRRNGVEFEIRETVESALAMGQNVLTALGVSTADASQTIEDIRERDQDRLNQQIDGNIRSGMERLHVAPVSPEPLTARD
ncbi:MAG: cation:proton antiporter [Pseudomonadota bacterium]